MIVKIGDCRLILGDSFKLLSKLPNVDAVITDPPYNYQFINYDWDSNRINSNYATSGMVKHVPYNNKLGGVRNAAWYKARRAQDMEFYSHTKLLVRLASSLLNEGGYFLQFCDHKSLGIVQASHKRRLYLKDTLVWVRSTGPTRGRSAVRDGIEELQNKDRSAIMNMWEGIVVSQTRIEGNSPSVYKRTGLGYIDTRPGNEHVTNVFYDTKKACDKHDHPTVKPLSLMLKLVQMYCPRGKIVLDPFLGSGTTAVACIMQKRKFIGIERDKHYFKMACKRIEAAYEQDSKKLW